MQIVYILLIASVLVMLIAAAGVWRLPGALARQHAATNAATLALSLFLVANIGLAIVADWGWEWLARLILLQVILLITLPLAAHALGRSAVCEKTFIAMKSLTD